MQITMTQGTLGTEDGQTVRFYPEGMTADVREALACHFIATGKAVRAGDPIPARVLLRRAASALKRVSYNIRLLSNENSRLAAVAARWEAR